MWKISLILNTSAGMCVSVRERAESQSTMSEDTGDQYIHFTVLSQSATWRQLKRRNLAEKERDHILYNSMMKASVHTLHR